MPAIKELNIRMEDRAGTLGEICQALADRKVNILAFQSIPRREIVWFALWWTILWQPSRSWITRA
jgi:ACT domain-containing protein